MKLTNTIRDAFVRAAINDVPYIDYGDAIRKALVADAVSQLPGGVRALWKSDVTRSYVATFWFGSRWSGLGAQLPGVDGNFKASPEVMQKADELDKASKQQEALRTSLKSQLKGAAYSVSTRKALATLLPEFEKYLPADEAAACKTLPAVQNIVADFAKAGWPKGKKTVKAREAA